MKLTSNLPLHELLKAFFEEHANLWARNTCQAYESHMRKFIRWIESKRVTKIKKIQSQHFVGYLGYLDTIGMTEGSQLQAFSVARKFWKWLMRHEIVEKDIMALLSAPRIKKKSVNIPEDQDFIRLIEAIEGEGFYETRNRAMLELLYSSGLRANELMNLQLEDWSFDRLEVRIVGAKRNKIRTVPVTQRAAAAIEKWIELFRHREPGFLFFGSTQKGIKRDRLCKVIEHYSKIAGVKVSPHSFRHACATRLLRKGADLKLIKELLGHESIDTTQRYLHLTSADINKKFQTLMEG